MSQQIQHNKGKNIYTAEMEANPNSIHFLKTEIILL